MPAPFHCFFLSADEGITFRLSGTDGGGAADIDGAGFAAAAAVMTAFAGGTGNPGKSLRMRGNTASVGAEIGTAGGGGTASLRAGDMNIGQTTGAVAVIGAAFCAAGNAWHKKPPFSRFREKYLPDERKSYLVILDRLW